MHRFCRSYRLCIWCSAILFVFPYVLFDLLDIDGSDLRSLTEGSAVAEEVLVTETKDPATGCPSALLAGSGSPSLARAPYSIPPALTSASNLHGLLVVRPRRTTQERMASSSRPEGDPARRAG